MATLKQCDIQFTVSSVGKGFYFKGEKLSEKEYLACGEIDVDKNVAMEAGKLFKGSGRLSHLKVTCEDKVLFEGRAKTLPE